jgi:hypothetical protein
LKSVESYVPIFIILLTPEPASSAQSQAKPAHGSFGLQATSVENRSRPPGAAFSMAVTSFKNGTKSCLHAIPLRQK